MCGHTPSHLVHDFYQFKQLSYCLGLEAYFEFLPFWVFSCHSGPSFEKILWECSQRGLWAPVVVWALGVGREGGIHLSLAPLGQAVKHSDWEPLHARD